MVIQVGFRGFAPQTTRCLTLEAEAVELAGDVSYEALGGPAKAKFGNQVTDDVVQGLVVNFHSLRSQHVLPQETSHFLPLLSLAVGINSDVTNNQWTKSKSSCGSCIKRMGK